MKKLILSLAVLMAAGTVSAQDKVVRKARDLQIEVQNLMANKQRDEKETAQMHQKMQQCIEMIEPTLTSDLTVKEKANAWDIKASMEMYQFSPEVDKIIAKQPFDTLAFATHLYASLDAMEQCYKIEKETGRVLVEVSPEFYRPTDVVNLWGDPSKAKRELGWNPTKTSFEELVRLMVAHDMKKVSLEPAE